MALANALAIGALAATRRYWMRRGPDPVPPTPATRPRSSHVFHLLVAGAVVLCAVQAWPRLSQSLWDDEEMTARRNVVGHWVQQDGEIRRVDAHLRHALFTYNQTNNHVFYSALASLSVFVADTIADPAPRLVAEPALRLPAYLAGIASIAALAFWLAELGLPGAGVLAAWLLALHPWHLRYASEARGYSLLMLLLPLSLIALERALARGRLVHWVAFALCQFLIMWTYPAALFLVSTLTLGAVVAIVVHHGYGAVGREQLRRLALPLLFGALAYAQLMFANAMQALEHGYARPKPELVADFSRNLASYALAGMPWSHRVAGPYPQLSAVADAWPIALPVVAFVALAAAVVGAIRLTRHGLVGPIGVAALVLPPLLTEVSVELSGSHSYVWHHVYVLPLLTAVVALGLCTAARRLPRGLRIAGALLVLVSFAAITQPARAALRERSLQPMRESAQIARGTLDVMAPGQEGRVTAVLEEFPLFYDPRAHRIRKPADLARLAESLPADAELFAHVGRWNKRTRALFRDPALFEPIATLYGFEPRLTRRVYRLRPGAAALLAARTQRRDEPPGE